MATLPDVDRQRIHRGLMRYWSGIFEELGNVSKTELKAAVDTTDQWIEDNQTSFNNALPNPFKTQATQAQKTLLFCAVALMRVSGDFLRRVLGEVD
jgi:hypothetical protein